MISAVSSLYFVLLLYQLSDIVRNNGRKGQPKRRLKVVCFLAFPLQNRNSFYCLQLAKVFRELSDDQSLIINLWLRVPYRLHNCRRAELPTNSKLTRCYSGVCELWNLKASLLKPCSFWMPRTRHKSTELNPCHVDCLVPF